METEKVNNVEPRDRDGIFFKSVELPDNKRAFALYDNGIETPIISCNGETGTSTVFKISKTDGNCATFEVLAPNPDTTNPLIPYVSTNSFFTIDLDCVLAIRCLSDTFTN